MTKQKLWNADNKTDYWAIKHPLGVIFLWTIRDTKKSAIAAFTSTFVRLEGWQGLYKEGYRAVKIRIVEME